MFKVIPNTYGLYSINNNGEVKRGNKILKHSISRGYHYITICIKGKTYQKSIHRLVAELFLENPKNKPHVNHKDGDKNNNNVNNLEWVTLSENQLHRYRVLKKYTPVKNFSKSIKVVNNIEHKYFDSIREACRYYNLDNSYISKLFKINNIINVKGIELQILRKEN